jgi:4-hydroxybutyryl-CoA dehydratase/vinylacetyl-CoA-Delta-isomerase
MKANVWAYGEKVDDIYAHPCFKPAIDAIGLVYALSGSDASNDSQGVYTVHSPFTGGRISRFLHIHQTREDLKKRFELSRNLVRMHGACIGARCVSTSVLNAVFKATFDLDHSTGRGYHVR